MLHYRVATQTTPNLEELWIELSDAKLRLDSARKFSKQVQTDRFDRPDRLYVFRRALCAERAALTEYRHLLYEVYDCLTKTAETDADRTERMRLEAEIAYREALDTIQQTRNQRE